MMSTNSHVKFKTVEDLGWFKYHAIQMMSYAGRKDVADTIDNIRASTAVIRDEQAREDMARRIFKAIGEVFDTN